MGNSGNGQRFNSTKRFKNNAGAPQKRVEIVETGNSNSGNATVWCYNYNWKGHMATACPKQRTRGSKFHKQALLLALKDEASGTFIEKENSFMANAYSDDDMEDLEANATVMLMANMQELHMNDSGPVYDTDGMCHVHDPNTCLIHEIASPTASASDKEQVVQTDSSTSPQKDDQMNTILTFHDEEDQINPVVHLMIKLRMIKMIMLNKMNLCLIHILTLCS